MSGGDVAAVRAEQVDAGRPRCRARRARIADLARELRRRGSGRRRGRPSRRRPTASRPGGRAPATRHASKSLGHEHDDPFVAALALRRPAPWRCGDPRAAEQRSARVASDRPLGALRAGAQRRRRLAARLRSDSRGMLPSAADGAPRRRPAFARARARSAAAAARALAPRPGCPRLRRGEPAPMPVAPTARDARRAGARARHAHSPVDVRSAGDPPGAPRRAGPRLGAARRAAPRARRARNRRQLARGAAAGESRRTRPPRAGPRRPPTGARGPRAAAISATWSKVTASSAAIDASGSMSSPKTIDCVAP